MGRHQGTQRRKRKVFRVHARGAFARSMASQLDANGINFHLLEQLPEGSFVIPLGTTSDTETTSEQSD